MPLDVKAGDTILFGKYSGQEVRVDGVDYLIMKEDDVLAVHMAIPPRQARVGDTTITGIRVQHHRNTQSRRICYIVNK